MSPEANNTESKPDGEAVKITVNSVGDTPEASQSAAPVDDLSRLDEASPQST